jgi:hypothetical protein
MGKKSRSDCIEIHKIDNARGSVRCDACGNSLGVFIIIRCKQSGIASIFCYPCKVHLQGKLRGV